MRGIGQSGKSGSWWCRVLVVLCFVMLASTVAQADPASPASAPVFATAPYSVDLSSQSDNSVTAYTLGPQEFNITDIYPTRSDSGGYVQKWEFYINTKPYSVRIRFELSNFAFSKNEGKIGGYVRHHAEDGSVDAEYKLSKTYKSEAWTSSAEGLDLRFGEDYSLRFDGRNFVIHGTYEKGTFDYVVEPNFWKPGTGSVYFGKAPENVFRYGILAYNKDVLSGAVSADGREYPVEGYAYANHYMTNMAVYEIFDELSDFRRLDKDLLVEFRYFVPGAKYPGAPFGFLFVAYDGVPVFSTAEITRTSLEKWLDDSNYNYEIDSRQLITGTEEGNRAEFRMLKARPEASDPYANLPSFQRAIATRFAKPITYSISIDWQLYLDVDGMKALIPLSSTYSLTRMR